MASPEQPRPPSTTTRPKYLGPSPPLYPGATTTGSSPPEAAPKGRWKPRLAVGVAGLALALGIWTGAQREPKQPEAGGTGPDDATQAMIDEVVGATPPPAVTVPTTAAPAPAGREIAQFRGTGPGATPTFTVDGAWELRWESQSGVSISVYRTSDQVVVGTASQPAGGLGSLLQPQAGSYVAGVTATGDWTITVVAA